MGFGACTVQTRSDWYVFSLFMHRDPMKLMPDQGVDMKDIRIVIQWRLTCELKTLWQRIGRAVRELSLNGTAIVFVEAKYFDENRARREASRKKPAARVAGTKRAATDQLGSEPPAKVTRTTVDASSSRSAPVEINTATSVPSTPDVAPSTSSSSECPACCRRSSCLQSIASSLVTSSNQTSTLSSMSATVRKMLFSTLALY